MILVRFSHDQSDFSNTTFQNFKGISRLLSEMSHVAAPHKAVLQIQHFINFFLKFNSSLLVKSFFFFFLSASFAMSILNRIPPVYPASFILKGHSEILTSVSRQCGHLCGTVQVLRCCSNIITNSTL